MPCNGPLDGWASRERTALGKRAVTFRFKDAYHDLPVTVPCGKCLGCRLERSREWALRCVHEAQLWEKNVFVTLTYTRVPTTVTGVPSLRPRDFQLFMKRLRKSKFEGCSDHRPDGQGWCSSCGIRFLQAGEYGERLGRPHHHAILFNCGFADGVPFSSSRGNPIFRSKELEAAWPHGYSSYGAVTFESAAYVARYTVKKAAELEGSPEAALSAAEAVRLGTRVPEYITMSRRPGIGSGWLEKFRGDVYPHDEVVMKGGRKFRPPRFYDERYGRQDPDGLAKLKAARARKVDPEEQRGSRLETKAELTRRRVADFLKREVE